MHARSAAAQRGQLPSDCGEEGHAEPAGAGLRAAWAGLASRAAAERRASEPKPRSSLKKGLRVKNGDAAVGFARRLDVGMAPQKDKAKLR